MQSHATLNLNSSFNLGQLIDRKIHSDLNYTKTFLNLSTLELNSVQWCALVVLPRSCKIYKMSTDCLKHFLLKDLSKKKTKNKEKRRLKLQQYPLVLQTLSESQFERYGRHVTKQIKK